MEPSFYAFRSACSYEEALRLQGVVYGQGQSGLLAFEPKETITFGKAANRIPDLLVSESYLAQENIDLVATDRGGKTTYHGPGQLVGFPLVNLISLYKDGRAVKRFTEELLLGLAHACAVLGVKSVETRSDFPGLWTNRGKLASIGIAVKDGFVFHGFSLNVHNSCLRGFSLIQSCGIQDCPVTTLELEGVRVDNLHEIALRILPYLSVIQGEKLATCAKTISHENSQNSLMSKVSRSETAIDQLRNSFEDGESHREYN